jgi:uncharacterized damage-inducible protein DinB
MSSRDVFLDAFDRVSQAVHGAVRGLTREQLAHRIDPGANSIAWLIWHLTRVQDDHICDLAGTEQMWTAQGWADRFSLPLPVEDTGYGHTSEEVAAVRVGEKLLTGYHDAVHAHTAEYLQRVNDRDLGKGIDTSWDPPVTLGVRIVSVIADDLEHAGQAAFIRGVLKRAG